MILTSIASLTVVIAYTSAGVIPLPKENGASDLFDNTAPVHKQKTVAILIAELKELETSRHKALKKAEENPKFAGNRKMARYLADLVEFDTRLFVYAVRLLDSLDTLDHPDGKRIDELQKATNLILEFKQNQDAIKFSISDIKAQVDEERDDVPDELLETQQMEGIKTAFQLTYLKLFEAFKIMEVESSQVQYPYSRDYLGSQLMRVLYN